MRFNYKKISAIATSVLLTGLTVSAASAVSNPADLDNPAVVYGAESDDSTSATGLGNYISENADDSTTEVSEESVKLERSSDKFNLGDSMDSVFITNIDVDDLSNILATKDFQGDTDSYEYTQKIAPAGLSLEHFQDKDYNDKENTLGFHIGRDEAILNYTLQFSSSPDFTDAEMKDEEIEILGKNYYILSLENKTTNTNAGKLTLLDSANSATLEEGETRTIEGKEVAVDWIGDNNVELTIDGESASLTSVGDTDKLSDGSYVALKTWLTTSKEQPNKAEIVIGNGEVVLEDTNEVTLNSDTVDNLYAHFDASNSGSTDTLNSITLQWKAEEESFVTTESEFEMPALASIKLSMTDFVAEEKETLTVENDGTQEITLGVSIKGGSVDIPILAQTTDNQGQFDKIGESADSTLYTGNSTGRTLKNINTTSENAYLVASWKSGTEAESYYFDVDTTKDGDTHKAEFKSQATGDTSSAQAGSDVTFGNVVINVDAVNDTTRIMNLSLANTDESSFKELYTAEGATVYLPFNSTTSTATGAINLTSNATGSGSYPQVFTLNMTEEDKDENIGSGGSLVANLSFNSDNETTVSDVGASSWAAEGSDDIYEIDSSNDYEGYVASELGSKIVHSTGGDQDTVEITYNGEEAYGEVYISSTATTSSDSGSVVLKDNEDYSGRDVIIVGGSCINSAAADVLTNGEALCGEDFTAETGVGDGEFILKGSEDDDGNVVVVAAGYRKADTTRAVNLIQDESFDEDLSSVDKVYTVSDAEEITEAE